MRRIRKEKRRTKGLGGIYLSMPFPWVLLVFPFYFYYLHIVPFGLRLGPSLGRRSPDQYLFYLYIYIFILFFAARSPDQGRIPKRWACVIDVNFFS